MRTTASLAKSMSIASVVLKTNARVRVSAVAVADGDDVATGVLVASRTARSVGIDPGRWCTREAAVLGRPSDCRRCRTTPSVTWTLRPTWPTLVPVRASTSLHHQLGKPWQERNGSSCGSSPSGIRTVPLMVCTVGAGVADTATLELPPPQPAISMTRSRERDELTARRWPSRQHAGSYYQPRA